MFDVVNNVLPFVEWMEQRNWRWSYSELALESVLLSVIESALESALESAGRIGAEIETGVGDVVGDVVCAGDGVGAVVNARR